MAEDHKTEAETRAEARTDKLEADRVERAEKAADKAEKAEADKAERAEKAEAKAAKGKLARAAESGDPEVQRLMAEREGHKMNVQPDPNLHQQREAAENAIKNIDEQLAARGFSPE